MIRRGVRGSARWTGLFVLVGTSLSCAEQAFVSYQGTVSEVGQPDHAGYDFGDPTFKLGGVDGGGVLLSVLVPYPLQSVLVPFPPVAGASVSLCPEARCNAQTDAEGRWGPIFRNFPLLGGKRAIEITVTAPGYQPLVYQADYPETSDPLFGEEPLNFRLVHDPDAGAPDAAGDAGTDGG